MSVTEEVFAPVPKTRFYDDIAKGAITLVIGAVVSNLVDSGYDKLIVARRTKPIVEN